MWNEPTALGCGKKRSPAGNQQLALSSKVVGKKLADGGPEARKLIAESRELF